MNKIKELTPEEVRKMQLMQLDMLVEFDRVCRKHNIKYTIFGGTLLGAIRHKGYIPWDDDADIAMLREEYEKFRKVSDELNSEICYFQDYNNDPEYRWGYSKLRRSYTEYIRVGQEHLKCKTGFFVDIFPMDDIPKSTFGQIIDDFHNFVMRKILWSEVGKYDKGQAWYKRLYFKVVSHISPKFIFKKLERRARKSKNDSKNRVRTLLFPASGKLYNKNSIKTRYGMPKSWFTDLAEYEFEGVKLFGTRDYDENLKYIYGDYMTLPPEDKRDPHSPVSEYSFDTRLSNDKKV